MKNVYGVNNPREEVLVIETPTDVMKNDVGNKKSAIYHPPAKSGKTHAQERREYKEKCGDVRAIKLGHPMDWPNFLTLSDDTKREYLESVFSKYPGINIKSICPIFNSCFRKNEIEAEILRLGFNFDKADNAKCVQDSIYRDIANNKRADIEAAAAKAKKPKRVSFKEIRNWPEEKALKYFQNVYDYYNRSLAISDFCKLCSVSTNPLKRKFIEIGFDLISFSASRTEEAKVHRDRFCKEMLSDTAKAEPIAEDTSNSNAEEVACKKNNVQIDSISIVVDANDIDSIAEILESFSGTVRIHIEKE